MAKKKKKKVAKKAIVKGKPKAKAKKKDMTRWANIPAKVILAAADICDGHSIINPEAFLKLGVPKAMVKAHTRTIKSDFSDHKATIFDNKTGKPVKSMDGVYGLDLLADIVYQLELPYREFFGRGSQARDWQRAIVEHFDKSKKQKA
jgi:hypothetical protein